MTMNQRDLFKTFLNLDKELTNNIYLTLSYMDYNIYSEVYNLNEGTYINQLIDYIYKDQNLRNLINECLLKEIDDNKDFIKQIFKKKDAVYQNDIDKKAIIQTNLSKFYMKLLNIFIIDQKKTIFFLLYYLLMEKIQIKKLLMIHKLKQKPRI